MEKVLQTNVKLNEYLEVFAKAFLGSLVIFLSAGIRIPFYPVDFTAHTLAIFLIALTQRPKVALFSTLLYLGYESFGLSLSGSATVWYLTKSMGYFLGFPVAAYVISVLSRKISAFNAVMAGQAIIYFFGVTWLSLSMGLEYSLYYGLLIFVPSAIVKGYTAQVVSKLMKKL